MRRLALLALFALLAAACGGGSDEGAEVEADETADAAETEFEGELVIGAIPDQDPEILARNYELVANYLAEEVGVTVRFEPVTEYDAAVTAFRVGDLDLVWFGGLTGVQARLQVDGAEAIAQRLSLIHI